MRYRFVRAFIVEGLLARERQEIVLSDEPGEGRKFVLTGSSDSWRQTPTRRSGWSDHNIEIYGCGSAAPAKAGERHRQ
jgi:hypothetical protein